MGTDRNYSYLHRYLSSRLNMASTIDKLLIRAIEQGVQIFGVRPADIPGHGVGLAATCNLKAGDVVMVIPAEAIHSLHTIPKFVARKLPPNIALHHTISQKWAGLVPKWTDFEATIPYLWPEQLR